MKLFTLRTAVLAACLLGGTAFAQTVQADQPVHADQAWARATAPQQAVGSAYVRLTSPAADRLVSASSPAAAQVTIHQMQMEGSIMRMRALPNGLVLPPGQAVTLEPGGNHLMLEGLTTPLVAGQTIALQLKFEHAPPLDLQVTVAPAGARGPVMGMHH